MLILQTLVIHVYIVWQTWNELVCNMCGINVFIMQIDYVKISCKEDVHICRTNFANKIKWNLHETTNWWKMYGKQLFYKDFKIQDDGQLSTHCLEGKLGAMTTTMWRNTIISMSRQRKTIRLVWVERSNNGKK